MDTTPSQMFVRGMMPELARQGCFTDPNGEINFNRIGGAIKELRIRWEANYPEDRKATATSGKPDRGRGGAPQGAAVPSAEIPAADMTHFHEWADETIGIGKKQCKAVGKVWSGVTWREAVDHVMEDQSRGSDFTFLQWLSTSLDNKTQGSKETTARAKAVVAAIQDPFG